MIWSIIYVSSSSIQFYRIIKKGFKPFDPNNLAPREIIDEQLRDSSVDSVNHLCLLLKLTHHWSGACSVEYGQKFSWNYILFTVRSWRRELQTLARLWRWNPTRMDPNLVAFAFRIFYKFEPLICYFHTWTVDTQISGLGKADGPLLAALR